LAIPVYHAAIDAGSNALRLVIARSYSPRSVEILRTERVPVRLGRHAFTNHRLDQETLARTARAFRDFRRVMDRFGVVRYRAVATAAAREATNRRALIERVRRKSGIELEIISGEEEARLVRQAVLASMKNGTVPSMILDLGGGSLELNFMRGAEVERCVGLPLGTVRLMETQGISGAISEEAAARLRLHVLSVLRTALQQIGPPRPDLAGKLAVACGGNAEALAQLAPGTRARNAPQLNLRLLRERLWQILDRDVPGRMKYFGLRRDRAEVLGVAAIVLSALGEWMHLDAVAVPGVGVREGVLLDLVAAEFGPAPLTTEQTLYARRMVSCAEWFARRHDFDASHAEAVRVLALSLFDQLRPVHQMEPEMRVLLAVAATLHDVGQFIHSKSHHRHGDYLIRNADIPGLKGWRRNFVACLVRYHNGKSDPQTGDKPYDALDGPRRRDVSRLAGLLRIAEKLETAHEQSVESVDVEVQDGMAHFRVWMRNDSRLVQNGLTRRAALFEKEFHLTPEFRRAFCREEVA
jgi:exopolyphosphatase/guanosine-5'-triphosphate,3'-diphosphate pyrophosphatase